MYCWSQTNPCSNNACTAQCSNPPTTAAGNFMNVPHWAQSITPVAATLPGSLPPRSAARPRECCLGPSAGSTAGTLPPRCAAPAPPSPGRRRAPPGTGSVASCGHGTRVRSDDCAPAWLACHPACRCCCARLPPPPRRIPQSCPSCAGPACLRDSPPPLARCKLATDRCRRRA